VKAIIEKSVDDVDELIAEYFIEIPIIAKNFDDKLAIVSEHVLNSAITCFDFIKVDDVHAKISEFYANRHPVFTHFAGEEILSQQLDQQLLSYKLMILMLSLLLYVMRMLILV